jgi:N-acetylglucosaminyldiphosphoundecaprenol N-acetyl-beta-D-mannosaminyltransferase
MLLQPQSITVVYRAFYTRLIPQMLEKCNEQRLSVFLLGTKPNYLEAAIEKLKQQYPNAKFFGHHGHFYKENAQQNEAVIKKINKIKPNVLFVDMEIPVQEKWVLKHRNRLQVNAIILRGAIIDRLAGIVPNCPKSISHVGLEWLYRLCHLHLHCLKNLISS